MFEFVRCGLWINNKHQDILHTILKIVSRYPAAGKCFQNTPYPTLERSFGDGSPPQGIMDLVCFSRPKELYLVLEATKFHLESDEVLYSP